MSFGASAYNMDKALDKLNVANAAVTPDEAMVDPVEAQSAMIDHTIDLAMQAITVGMEVGAALEGLEAGRVKDLEKLAGRESRSPRRSPSRSPGSRRRRASRPPTRRVGVAAMRRRPRWIPISRRRAGSRARTPCASSRTA